MSEVWPRDPLHWFDYMGADGGTWRVLLDVLPAEYAGLTLYEPRIIRVDVARQGIDAQNETLAHEVKHSVFPYSRKIAKREEYFIRRLSPGLWKTLRRLGFRWPDRPDGFASYYRAARRWARKVDA